MANQTITVAIPAGDTVVAAFGVIMTLKGRVVLDNQTSPLLPTDPKALLIMLEHARNEVNKTPIAPTRITNIPGIRRS